MKNENICDGCGVRLQYEDESLPGYTPSEMFSYCKRCFRLINYSDISDENAKTKNIDKILEDSVVLYVIDSFYLWKSLDRKFIKRLKNKKTIIILNKWDLISKNERKSVFLRIEKFFSKEDLKYETIFVHSNKKKSTLLEIKNYLKRLKEKNIYVFGMINSGKSTLVNLLTDSNKITTSSKPNTTLDVLHVSFDKEKILIDTPGFKTMSVDAILTEKTSSLLVLKKRPSIKTYQVRRSCTFFIGGFLRLDLENPVNFTLSVKSPNLVIHKTNTANADLFFKDHQLDILLLPRKKDLNLLGDFSLVKRAEVNNRFLIIPGLLEVKFIGKAYVKIFTYDCIFWRLKSE